MAPAIRVVVTQVYTYRPDLTETVYRENAVFDIADALKYDQNDVDNGAISVDELAVDDPITTYTWSVVDD